ncbi:MAG: hypothetical protein R2718_02235 [Solirubrobacterales bacterium]
MPNIGHRAAPKALLFPLALLGGLILLTQIGTGVATAKTGKQKVRVSVSTSSQKQLLGAGKLAVAVKSSRRGKVKVTAAHAGKRSLFEPKTIKLRGRRIVELPLTDRGEERLGRCGDKEVKVRGLYRAKGKKRKAVEVRNLRKDASRCEKPYEPVPVENADRCDFLDPAVCLQPFPNDYFTVGDPSTATGRRLNLNEESTPANINGDHIDPTDMNRADGFSPGNLITIKIPGLETPAAFAASGLVPENDLHAFDDADAPLIVINADTGERQPIWAELDSNPTSVDPSDDGPGGIGADPDNTGDVNLIVRPAENFDFGERYIVALRNLENDSGEPIEAPIGFRVFRDGDITDQPEVESRRAHMESVIDDLVDKAGVARDSLYMAWDFTVASEESVTGRATTIRDDAFARLGDTNLADREIQGDSPSWTITRVLDQGDPIPSGERGIPAQIARRVEGTINVPCYLDEDNCPSGAEFAHDPDGGITWDPSFDRDVEFRCEIPDSVVAGSGPVQPAAVGIYGHGLLGTQDQLTGQAALAQQENTIWCAMDFEGFAEQDLGTVIASLADMSNFNKLADRMQQGYVNFMYLGRALIHPSGLATDTAFAMDNGDGDQPVIDTSAGADTRLQYMGVSQGAIMGGALTALEPDADRGVLNVTGMNYSTLLRRSVDSDEYFKIPGIGLYANYPDELERPLLLSLVQLLWDRGEANGYAHNMTTDPLADTPPHEVLLQAALGDHQVANVAAEVEARTVGASVYTPALEPGRHWDSDPFLGIPQIDMSGTATPYTGGSMLVYYDGGPTSFTGTRGQGSGTAPSANVPPRPEWGFGGDPHGYPRAAADGLLQEGSFLRGDGVPQCLDASSLCYSNGYAGTP